MSKIGKNIKKKYSDMITGKLSYECNLSKGEAEKYALGFASFWKSQLIRYEHSRNHITCYISASLRTQIESLKEGSSVFLNIKDEAGNTIVEKSCKGKIVSPNIVYVSGDACMRVDFNGRSDLYSLQELSFTQKGGTL